MRLCFASSAHLLLVGAASAHLVAASPVQTARCLPDGAAATVSCASTSLAASTVNVGNASTTVTLLNQPVAEFATMTFSSTTMPGANITLTGLSGTVGSAPPSQVDAFTFQINRAGWYDATLRGSAPAASGTSYDSHFWLSKVGALTTQPCRTGGYKLPTTTAALWIARCVFYAALNDQYTVRYTSVLAGASDARAVSAELWVLRLVT